METIVKLTLMSFVLTLFATGCTDSAKDREDRIEKQARENMESFLRSGQTNKQQPNKQAVSPDQQGKR